MTVKLIFYQPVHQMQPHRPGCQEQIELSGFVAHELSAFSVLPEGQFSEQEVSGGRALSSIIFLGKELSTAILPRPLRSMREMVVGNSVRLPFLPL